MVRVYVVPLELVPESHRATGAQLAPLLLCTRQQVHTWAQRRASTGFPESVDWQLRAGGVLAAPRYDVQEVVHWWTVYEPCRGGAPRGERNGAYIDGRTVRPHRRR
jgi:hypothetical protein